MFRIDTDDTQGIAAASYTAPGAHAVGVFPLAGNPGSVAVSLPDGSYQNAIDGKPVTVRAGHMTIGTEAVIVL